MTAWQCQLLIGASVEVPAVVISSGVQGKNEQGETAGCCDRVQQSKG